MAAVDAVAPDLGATQACRALGISRATLYRRRRPPVSTARPSRARPPRALSDAERQALCPSRALCTQAACPTAPAGRRVDQPARADTGGGSVENPAWRLRTVDRFRRREQARSDWCRPGRLRASGS
jgi:hypothetical protein